MSTYDLEENRNNARLSTTSSSKANSNNQNDEESIFLSSSSDNDEIENVYAKKSKKYSSVNDVEYDDEDYEDDEPQSDNDNSFYDEDSGSRRRPIKVYDEYDPENIDDDDDYLSANNNNSKTRGRRNQMPYSPEAYQNITSDSSLSSNDSFSNKKRHSNSDNTNESSNDGDNDVRSNKKMINKVKKLAQSKPVSSSAKTAPKKIKKEDTSSTNSNKTSKTSKMIKLGTKSASITLKPTTTATIETSESSILTTGSKIINLSSGFKIPKRSSNETSAEVNAPPEKKAKISSSSNLDQGSKSNNKSSNSSSNIKQTNNKSSTNNNNNNNNKNTNKSSNSSTSKKPTVTASPKSSKSSSNQTKNELIESNFFMEALNTSTKSHTKSSKSKENNFKHKETSNNSNNTENKAKSDENKTNNSPTPVANSSEFNKPDLAQINNNYNKLLENNRIDNKVNLTEPSASSSSSASSKKKVTWADSYSKQLEQIQHFYLDEDEKSSKKIAFNSLKDFGKIEKLNEKEMMRFKMMSNETGVIDQFGKTDPSSQADNTNPNNIPWVLHTCDLPESTVKVEINSIEHEIQLKREQNTLAFMVFKQFLPDSPIEPTDTSISDPTITTKPIPLDDITHFHDTNNTSNDYIDTHENSMNKKTISFTDHQKRQNEMVKSNSIPPTQTASTIASMPSQLSSISSLFNLSQPKETPPVITLPTPNLDLDKINSLIKNEHELKKILSTFNNNNPSQTTNSTPDTLNTLINSTKSVAIDSNTNKFNNNNNNNNKSQVQQTRWGSPPRSSNNNNNNNNTNTNNNSNNNNNNTKTSWQQNNNNSNKFQQNEYRKPYNNTNNNNNNNNNNSNKPNNFNDSNPNGRNLFQNSFKRGIGNRSNGGGTFRNNDSDNFNRGGNGFNNRSSNNNFNQNNRNRFNGFNKNYSNNDSDQSNANTTPTSTTNTTPTATTSTTSQQGGRWI